MQSSLSNTQNKLSMSIASPGVDSDECEFDTLGRLALNSQRQAIFLIARTTLRMEGRRAALRWLCVNTSQDYEAADKLVATLVKKMRANQEAGIARKKWAKELLERETLPAEAGDGQPWPEPVLALVERIKTVVERENERKLARWAQLGPSAMIARKLLAVEQYATTEPILAVHRTTILADLAAITEAIHLAAAQLIEKQPEKERERLQSGCQTTANQDLAILCGQETYRNQLVSWANGVAMDIDQPEPVEIRSVAPKREGRLMQSRP